VDDLSPRQIELKIHGLTQEDHGRVPARVFANKLKQLVGALEAADAVANGKVVHQYVLASMHMSEPTAILAEIPIFDEDDGATAIAVFSDAVEGIKTNDQRVKRLSAVVRHISHLTSGVESQFGFAEVRTAHSNVIRIDDFLRKRATRARQASKGVWFDGAVFGSFDGTIKVVDVRGSLPQFKLTLSAGGKELDCVGKREDIEALGNALNHRVRVHGRAIYSSSDPLPVRMEVTSVDAVKAEPDFTRWKGAFRPFSASSWEGDA